MPSGKCGLNLDKNKRELEKHGTPMFPCGGYYTDITEMAAGDIPWHWHEEVEVFTIFSGGARVNVNGARFVLREGEGVFINSNALHSAQIEGSKGCILNTLVFHPELISGAAESVFEQRYVRPLLKCATLPVIPLRRETVWQREAIFCMREAFVAYNREQYGYEMIVRENLSHMWYLIVINSRPVLEAQSGNQSRDSIRIKKMLNHMHDKYTEPLDLRQVAFAAGIGVRECLRCFQKTIGMPPMQYLLKYRVSAAARMLTETDAPITEICARSGFDDPSYFSKVFKRFMSCTPSGYRKAKNKIPS